MIVLKIECEHNRFKGFFALSEVHDTQYVQICVLRCFMLFITYQCNLYTGNETTNYCTWSIKVIIQIGFLFKFEHYPKI